MSNVEKKKEPGMLTLVMVLAVISLVMAFLLGMVNNVTAPAIKENTIKKTQSLMNQVLPADSYEKIEYTGTTPYVDEVYKAGDAGYVVIVTPTSGFSGGINMMAGISIDGAVTGIAIINHAETSGLGANATKPEWQAQFIDTTEEVKVTKDGGTIQSITGSTITSRAVCDGVNAARAAVAELG
jgi:electron transport complex protein RnfG